MGGLLEFAINAGVCGVCLPAYASEFYKLRDAERRELVFQAISILNGRLPVVAQVNHVSTAYVAETARDLERAGAAAISVAVPRIFGLPERDPLGLWPSRTGLVLSNQTYRRSPGSRACCFSACAGS